MTRDLIKFILRTICRILFRVRVEGLKNLSGHDRMLIIANHESWLDGLLIGLFFPKEHEPVFVVYSGITRRLLFRMVLSLTDYLKVDTTSPLAMKKVVALIKSGRPVMIFPEGRLTTTGTLMKVYDGPAFAAVKTGATVVPVRLDGPGRSLFTRLSGLHPRQFFPKITISVMEPTSIEVPSEGTAKVRRKKAGAEMRKIMQGMLFHSDKKRTLYGSFVEAAKTFGMKRDIMVDAKKMFEAVSTPEIRNPYDLIKVTINRLLGKDRDYYTYGDLLQLVVGIGHIVAKQTQPGECIGVLMPNLAETVSMLIGTSAYGRVPAMLNYKAGTAGITDTCVAAGIKTVFTSHAFLEKAKLTADIEALKGIKVVYLEDAKAALGLMEKLAIKFKTFFPQLLDKEKDIEKPAVVLFTSGSEGKPKGVVLSHRAIVANVSQVRSVFDFSVHDRVLNALPIFHSFGLTGGVILPLLSGLHIVLYASPLHYKVIPELSYDRNCTILFGTSTFLEKYGQNADNYDFHKLRYVVAGAQKLSDKVRDLWFEKFGIRIFEGYGATETAPVLAVNTPMAYRSGTVGQLLPGIEHKLVPVPGIEVGGALFVKGPNVMSGYYRYENPGVLEPTCCPEFGAGWYSTGDVVTTADGFISIVGRTKRFAKVAGEMVSLDVVEKIAELASPQAMHASLALTGYDDKGDLIVICTTDNSLTREALVAATKKLGHPEIATPKKIVRLKEMPLLATAGKPDYVQLKDLALAA